MRFDANCGYASVPQRWALRIHIACLVSFTIAFDTLLYIILSYFILCYITLGYVILYYISIKMKFEFYN